MSWEPRVHLAIAIPGESMPIESVRSLNRLIMRVLTRPPSPIDGMPPRDFTLTTHYLASSILPYARTAILTEAFGMGATHVLMLDSDMTYPETTAHRLMAAIRRGPFESGFVAANCPTRRAPIRWTARLEHGAVLQSHRAAASKIELSEAMSVGVAVAMIDRELWDRIERPAFNFACVPATDGSPGGWIGEDIWFCARVRAAGGTVLIHNPLSLEVGHVGAHEFRAEQIPPGEV